MLLPLQLVMARAPMHVMQTCLCLSPRRYKHPHSVIIGTPTDALRPMKILGSWIRRLRINQLEVVEEDHAVVVAGEDEARGAAVHRRLTMSTTTRHRVLRCRVDVVGVVVEDEDEDAVEVAAMEADPIGDVIRTMEVWQHGTH